MADMEEKPRMEDFEIVMLKPKVSAAEAKPDDFERLAVTAADPLSALLSDAGQAKVKEGYLVLFAAKPGMLTDPEIQARARASSTSEDRSKL
jgi:hypothetical protein